MNDCGHRGCVQHTCLVAWWMPVLENWLRMPEPRAIYENGYSMLIRRILDAYGVEDEPIDTEVT